MRTMSLSYIQSWVSRLPPAERDLPMVVYDSMAYSPNTVLAEVRAGTPLGRELQRKVERGQIGTPEETLEALAEARLLKLLQERPVTVIRLVEPWKKPELSPEELKEEIRKKTPLGRRLIAEEVEYLKRVRERYA